MRIFRNTFVLICAGCGIAVTSQVPEFAQQYRQRLGGAVAELKVIVEDFDKDAAASNLERSQALSEMKGSDNAFSRDRGSSMERHISRFEGLSLQRREMEQSFSIVRPWHMLKNADAKITNETWQDFEAAIPLTTPGILWGAFGALILGGFGAMLARLVGGKYKEDNIDAPLPKAVKSNMIAPPIHYD